MSISNETAEEETDNKITISIEGDDFASTSELLTFGIKAEFNWDADYSKLCTKWEVEGGAGAAVCNGNKECCELIGLEPISENWDESFFLNYGRYGNAMKNTVSADVVYANYSIDAEEPYADIVYSNIASSEAEFYYSKIKFDGVCVESCILPGFN